ncbi:hypothetical protein BGX23_011124 [Mortierella sp. AD031]|nr:hypothetical protein BGX23_011124 [Mortierella sp. AD031]
MRNEYDSIRCIAFSPDGHRIVSGTVFGVLQIWEAATGISGPTWERHSGSITSVSFSPNGQLVATAGAGHTVNLWDVQARTLVSAFTGHSSSITGVAFSPDGSQMASCSDDKTVRLWEVTSIGSSFNSQGPSEPVSNVAYSPDGQSLVSCSEDGTLRQYNAATGDLGLVFSSGSRQPTCIAYSPDGLRIATSGTRYSDSDDVVVWNTETGVSARVLRDHESTVYALAFSSCSHWIATGSEDKEVRLWDSHSGKVVRVLHGHTSPVTSLQFSPNGEQLVSGSINGTIRVWEMGPEDSTVLVADAYLRLMAVVYSPNGQLIASRSQDKDFSDEAQPEWKCATVLQYYFGNINSVAWKPGTLEFVTGCQDGSLRVWKLDETTGGLPLQLCWGFGPAIFVASDATISDTALPSVVQGKGDLSRIRATRVELYDTFVVHWLGVNKRRLQDQKLDGTNRIALEVLLTDGFERNGVLYQKELAIAIFKEQEGRPVVDYSHMRDSQTWKARFFGLDPETALLRGASLLSRAGTQYRFESLDSTATLKSIADHPLSQRNLVVEPSIVQFLAERVQLFSAFKHHLHAIIELSKADDQASQAAANAITILVKAGIQFNGAELRGIRIPGADLSGGQFDSAQLQDADLTGVNLTRSWIRLADLSNASMERVRFGELPYLEEDNVNLCVFSPDGKTLAVGLSNGDINIYDSTTWARIRTFQGYRKSITSLAYSPTSLQLLSGSEDHSVRICNCETGVSEFVMKGHSDGVVEAFSPSAELFASVSNQKSVKLWNVRTGAVDFDLDIGGNYVTSVTFSPNGEQIAVGNDYGEIRLFDTQTGLPGLVLDLWSCVTCIAYSPDGLRIISGNLRSGLQLWDTATGTPGLEWTAHSGYVTNVTFSPNGQLIASSGDDNAVRLWDAQTEVLISAFTGHSGLVACVAFSPDGSQMASCSVDKTVRLWKVTSTGLSLDSHGPSDPIICVVYSPNGRSLTTGSENGQIRYYDAVTGIPGLVIHCRGDPVRCVAYSPTGLQVATTSTRYASCKDVVVWNAETGVSDLVLQGHESTVYALAFSSGGLWIVTCSKDNTVRLWSPLDSQEACGWMPCRPYSRKPGHVLAGYVLAGNIETVTSVAFSPTPSALQLVSGSHDGTLRIWEVETGESREFICGGLSSGARSVVYSPDGLQIVACFWRSNKLYLWNEQTEKLLHTLEHSHDILCFALSSCGQWITTGCGNSMWLWNLAGNDTHPAWRCVAIVRDFFGDVESVAWTHETLKFATGSRDGSIRVWRLQDEPGGLSAQLIWGFGCTPLAVSGAVITDTVGLSPTNRKLLTQRGAIDASSPPESE